MGLESAKSNKKISMFLAFLLSSITGIIGIILWFTIRETLMVLITVSSINVWSHSAIDNFSFLLLGIGWLVLVYFSHYFYQKGYRKGRMLANFALLTSIQVFLFLLCKVMMIISGFSTGTGQIMIAVIEGLVGIGLLMYGIRSKAVSTGKSITS